MMSNKTSGLNSSPKPSPLKRPQNTIDECVTSPVKLSRTSVIGKPIEIIKGKYHFSCI